MTWIWLGMIIVLTLLEVIRTNFVTLFFVCSATISLILSLFIDNFIIQFSIFIILGLILLVTLRDKVLKLFNDKKRGKNEK